MKSYSWLKRVLVGRNKATNPSLNTVCDLSHNQMDKDSTLVVNQFKVALQFIQSGIIE